MRAWHRFTVTVVACAAGVTLACSGKTTAGGSATSACDDYFQIAFTGSCSGNVPLPASEVARIQARFDTLCNEALALPGMAITSGGLESCVAAIKAGGCSVADGQQPNGPCTFSAGSLASGTSCLTDDQCQSGACTAGNEAPDGGTVLCGTCSTPVAVGQSCASGQSCGPSAVCNGPIGTSGPTCATITFGAVGAACNDSSTECNAGLYCEPSTQKCAAPGDSGTACDTDQACTSPLVCPPAASPGASTTCQSPGAAGAACSEDAGCVVGLGCTQAGCATVTWASAGQPCSDTVRCLVGGCPSTGTTVGGVCPTVIPDGQACTPSVATATCDTFANCEGGTCVLGYPACQ